MIFSELNNEVKRKLFEFISHLAILAGREMSEEGYAHYNDVIMEFLEDVALLDDFMMEAERARRSKLTGNY